MSPWALPLAALLLSTSAPSHWIGRALAQSAPEFAPMSATPAVPSASATPGNAATKVLLDQANFWYAQDRPDDAKRSLQRLS
jgi:hypothetical protein